MKYGWISAGLGGSWHCRITFISIRLHIGEGWVCRMAAEFRIFLTRFAQEEKEENRNIKRE